MSATDLYAVLGIDRSASEADVRIAYKRCALRTHPDKGGASEQFQRVIAAFEILGDASSRAAYDRRRMTSKALHSGTRARNLQRQHRPCDRPRAETKVPEQDTQETPTTGAASSTYGEARESASKRHCAAPTETMYHEAHESTSKRHSYSEERDDDVRSLVEQLLPMTKDNCSKNLRNLSEETLKRVASFLEKDHVQPTTTPIGETSPIPYSPARKKQLLDDDSAMDTDDSEKESETDSNDCTSNDSEHDSHLLGEGEGDEMLALQDAPRTAECSTDANVKPRGLFRKKRVWKACLSVAGMAFYVTKSSLDAAIDEHMALVKLRQYVRAALNDGQDFPQAIKHAMERTQEERKQANVASLKLRFHIRNRTSPNLLGALAIWETHCRAHFDKRVMANKLKRLRAQRVNEAFLERQRKREEQWAEKEKRAAERRARFAKKRKEKEERAAKKHARVEARAEAKREAAIRKVQTRKEKQDAKANAIALKRRKRLCQLLENVTGVLKRLKDARVRAIRKQWGFNEWPTALNFGTIEHPNDCVYMELRLQDGTIKCGPSRQSIEEASRDLLLIQHIQKRRGEVAALAELERLDVEAMTQLFMERLDK